MAQTAVEKRELKNYDWARSGRMAFYGGGTPYQSAYALYLP